MIKTAYQVPELRNANDEVVQEGAFGKNTALSNSTNDGWIDYVMNDLEALHDTIGDSSPTLDGNGHVVEPANLAIGDEDGLRIKTGYLKLTGGTMSGTLNVAQNVKFQDNQENVFGGVYIPSSSSTEQYAQFYGGESTGVAGAKLTLYPAGDGRFKLDARSTDGGNTYTLVTDNNGNLNWRGYPLAWKKDYLPLAGGTMTGTLLFNPDTSTGKGGAIARTDSGIRIASEAFGVSSAGAYIDLYGRNYSTNAGTFIVSANSASGAKNLVGKTDGTLTWGGNNIALAKDYLPLAGGTMTGTLYSGQNDFFTISKVDGIFNQGIRLWGGYGYSGGASLYLYGKNNTNAGDFVLYAHDGTNAKAFTGHADGTLTWGGTQLAYETSAIRNVSSLVSTSGSNTATFEMRGNSALVAVKRGANAQLFMCDYWTANSVTLSSVGSAIATVTKTANSNTVTITNTSSSAVSVQIVSGANLL